MRPPQNIGIAAGTLTGNRGSEAMVRTCIDELRSRFPGAAIHVLSYHPAADRAEPLPPSVFVHASTPARLLLCWLPSAVLLKFLPFLKRRAPAAHGAGIRSLLALDAVLDVAGVSFIDGREIFLGFNVLSLLPFLLHGIPVFKVSQTMGPIRSAPNRLCARWVLSRCRLVVARGRATRAHLDAFGLPAGRVLQGPDVSFLMESPAHRPVAARGTAIGFSPSSLLARRSPRYLETLAAAARHFIARGHAVRLIAQAWRPAGSGWRNNDLSVIPALQRLIGDPAGVTVAGPALNARALRSETAACRVLVTSRFHGMINALATGTPPVVIGWGHKYREALDDFGLSSLDDPDAPGLVRAIQEALDDAERTGAEILARLPGVRSAVRAYLDEIFRGMERP